MSDINRTTANKVNLLQRLLSGLSESDVSINVGSVPHTTTELQDTVTGLTFNDIVNNVTISGYVISDDYGSRIVSVYDVQIRGVQYDVKVFSSSVEL